MNKIIKVTALVAGLLLPVTALAQETDWKVLSKYDKASAKKTLTQRLTDYVKFDTQSKASKNVPSTPGQLTFAKALAKELKKNGAVNVKVDKSGIVTAEVASNLSKPAPTVAFFAALDTAPELPGKDVKPQVHANYKGGEITLNAEKRLTLDAYEAPQLLRAKGHDLITSSGDTVLGAQNKAGIAILMTLVQFLYDNPLIQHGPIKIVFTPDSQTGAGIARLDAASLGADAAYTLDAGDWGTLVDETFNSKSFTAVFEGFRNVDPGQAINSSFSDNVLMASDFHTLLPRQKRPETTAYRNVFIWVQDISTQGNRTEVRGILRAFSEDEMNQLTNDVTQAFNTVKGLNYKGKNFTLSFKDQDKNMKQALPDNTLRLAELAMQAEEIPSQRAAARADTDGARLAAKGLPAPGLFTGYYQAHTLKEYADVDAMEASLRTVLRLATLWALQKPAN